MTTVDPSGADATRRTVPAVDGASIEAVLWDFGGVFTQSPFHHIDEYAAGLGATGPALVELVLGYDQGDGDHPWHRLERGELSLEDAARAVTGLVDAAGHPGFSIRDFFATMGGIDGGEHRGTMFGAVAAIKASGRRNSVVSNNIAEMSAKWQGLLPDGLFDDVIDSSAVGVRKPDPAIFALALDRLGGVDPSRAIFLDDHVGNVEAASACGLHAMVVEHDPRESAAELCTLLGVDWPA